MFGFPKPACSGQRSRGQSRDRESLYSSGVSPFYLHVAFSVWDTSFPSTNPLLLRSLDLTVVFLTFWEVLTLFLRVKTEARSCLVRFAQQLRKLLHPTVFLNLEKEGSETLYGSPALWGKSRACPILLGSRVRCGALCVFLLLNPQHRCRAWPRKCLIDITGQMQRP